MEFKIIVSTFFNKPEEGKVFCSKTTAEALAKALSDLEEANEKIESLENTIMEAGEW